MNVANRDIHAEPLSAHRLFRTTDIDSARQAVSRKFCAHDLIPGSAHRQFDICHNHASGRDLSLNYLRYGSYVSINPGELTRFYLIQLPVRGQARVSNGTKTVRATARTASVLNPNRETRMIWHKGCEKLLLQIDRDALHRTAESLVGAHLAHPVVFDPEINLAAPALRKWHASFLAAVDLAQQGTAFGTSPHKHQNLFEEELLTGFLLAQTSTISHMLHEAPLGSSPGQVHRARAFILENLSEPITIAEIARHADCSIRSLQTGFRQRYECTPMQYLTRQRLNQAHFLLQTLPETSLVSDIAFDCGFSHLGRFSIAYRQAFGRSPRDTQNAGRVA